MTRLRRSGSLPMFTNIRIVEPDYIECHYTDIVAVFAFANLHYKGTLYKDIGTNKIWNYSILNNMMSKMLSSI